MPSLPFPSSSQPGGVDRGNPQAADGPGVQAGVQWGAEPGQSAAQEHPG